MALESIKARFGRGNADVFGSGSGKLRNILVELQGLTISLVAGTTQDTNIPITGIATTDTLVKVIENAAGTLTDRTSTTSITSAGNIQCSVDTSGDQLLVFWFNKA